MKSSASTFVHVPVVRLVASWLYWKSIRSARLSGAEAPLLAGVGDGEGGDGRAGVVGETRAEGGNQGAAQQAAEGALRGAGGAEAVGVAGVAGARAGSVGRIGVGAGLGEWPAGGQRGTGSGVGERVEILLVGRTDGGEGNLCVDGQAEE